MTDELRRAPSEKSRRLNSIRRSSIHISRTFVAAERSSSIDIGRETGDFGVDGALEADIFSEANMDRLAF
jgi:hypothetical protein